MNYEQIVGNALRIVYKKLFPEEDCRKKWSEKVRKVLQRKLNLSEINRHLSEEVDSENCTEYKIQLLQIFLLRIVLDLETLQELCLLPPKGCPLENWVCCAGPCRSGKLLKGQNIYTVKKIRECVFRKKDLPKDYCDKYESVWGQFAEKGRKAGESAPLILFPVKELDPSVAKIIIAKKPELSAFIEHLFICSDHFKEKKETNNFDRRKLKNHYISNINKLLASERVKFKPNGDYHFRDKDYLNVLKGQLMNEKTEYSRAVTRPRYISNEVSLTRRFVTRLLTMDNRYYRENFVGFDNHQPDYRGQGYLSQGYQTQEYQTTQ